MNDASPQKLSVRLVSQEAVRRELHQALLAWQTAARVEAGVTAAFVYEDVVALGAFALEAELACPEALATHLRSRGFGALLGAIDILATSVRVSVCQPTGEFGVDALGAIRRIRCRSLDSQQQ